MAHCALCPACRYPTPRQRDVLLCVAAGLTLKATAARLHIQERTVKGLVGAARDRLDAQSTAQAVAHALAMGAITFEEIAAIEATEEDA